MIQIKYIFLKSIFLKKNGNIKNRGNKTHKHRSPRAGSGSGSVSIWCGFTTLFLSRKFHHVFIPHWCSGSRLSSGLRRTRWWHSNRKTRKRRNAQFFNTKKWPRHKKRNAQNFEMKESCAQTLRRGQQSLLCTQISNKKISNHRHNSHYSISIKLSSILWLSSLARKQMPVKAKKMYHNSHTYYGMLWVMTIINVVPIDTQTFIYHKRFYNSFVLFYQLIDQD